MEWFIIFIIIGLFIPPVRAATFGAIAAIFMMLRSFLGVVIIPGILVLIASLFKHC